MAEELQVKVSRWTSDLATLAVAGASPEQLKCLWDQAWRDSWQPYWPAGVATLWAMVAAGLPLGDEELRMHLEKWGDPAVRTAHESGRLQSRSLFELHATIGVGAGAPGKPEGWHEDLVLLALELGDGAKMRSAMFGCIASGWNPAERPEALWCLVNAGMEISADELQWIVMAYGDGTDRNEFEDDSRRIERIPKHLAKAMDSCRSRGDAYATLWSRTPQAMRDTLLRQTPPDLCKCALRNAKCPPQLVQHLIDLGNPRIQVLVIDNAYSLHGIQLPDHLPSAADAALSRRRELERRSDAGEWSAIQYLSSLRPIPPAVLEKIESGHQDGSI